MASRNCRALSYQLSFRHGPTHGLPAGCRQPPRFDELLPGSTTYLTNEPDACDDLLRECNFESAGHLGLDLEWTPTMVRGQQLAVSLLQLATRDHCLLIRVGEMRAMGVEALPPGLTRLLTTNPPSKSAAASATTSP